MQGISDDEEVVLGRPLLVSVTDLKPTTAEHNELIDKLDMSGVVEDICGVCAPIKPVVACANRCMGHSFDQAGAECSESCIRAAGHTQDCFCAGHNIDAATSELKGIMEISSDRDYRDQARIGEAIETYYVLSEE